MPRAQKYSSYKAHNIIKFLLAIVPNGFMFFSPAYGGRASDKYIMKECGVEDNLGPRDDITAHRGFSLSEYLDIQGVKLNMPAFTKGKGSGHSSTFSAV